GHLLQLAEQPALGLGQEAVQRHPVLLDGVVGEQGDLAAQFRQVVEGAHRRRQLVADAADVEHQRRRRLVHQLAFQATDHLLLLSSAAARPVRPAVALMCAWVRATARASAASACSFCVPRFSSKRTMCCTCAFSAAPPPTRDCLTRRGAYSCTGRPCRTTVAMAAPRACPSFSAEVADLSMNTDSIATTSGRHCASTSSRSKTSLPRRAGKSPVSCSRFSAWQCT